MKPSRAGGLGALACALGCSGAPVENVAVAIPVAGTQSAVAATPAAPGAFSIGERKLLGHAELPAIELPCDADRLAWANVNGEVSTYRFGDSSPERLPDMPGFGAIAWSGDELHAAVERDLRWKIVAYRAGAWTEIARDVAMPSRNIGADAQHVIWVARHGDEDALFVLDRRTGQIAPRPLGRAHAFVRRAILDRGHAFVLAEDSMRAPQLYDVSLDDSAVRALPDSAEIQDIGAADGILVGLRYAEERAKSDVAVIAGAPRRPLGRIATAYHPSVAVGGGVACYFSSDEDRAATIGCADLASGVTRVADTFESNWEFLAICGGKHLVWTRPAKPTGWDLVYADLLR